jgi:hypothetical protein
MYLAGEGPHYVKLPDGENACVPIAASQDNWRSAIYQAG